MVAQQKEKGRSKSGKSESFTLQQLKVAHDEYDDEATLCVFRLKSLKQGQFRSLLTQAARHHAAQVLRKFHTNLEFVGFSPCKIGVIIYVFFAFHSALNSAEFLSEGT